MQKSSNKNLMKQLVLYFLLVFAISLSAQNSKFVLVIDAGHGGRDIGAPGKITNEKKINLAITLKFGALVEKNFNDVRVVYTRKTDKYLELSERANIANSNHADLFISIHTNANDNRAPFGAETYTLGLHRTKDNLNVAIRENSVIMLEDNYEQKYKGFDPKSIDSYIMFELTQDKYLDRSVEFASNIQKQFVGYANRHDRGVRQAGFLVLHQTACPSVLIEVGFISNATEEKFLASDAGQQKMATAIYNAFVQYKKDYDKRNGKTISNVQPVEKESITETPTTTRNETSQPVTTASETPIKNENTKPVFKVQIIASSKKLAPNAPELKGEKNATYFLESGLYKYTVGAETDHNKIKELQKNVRKQFPDCFVIAFVGDKKMTERDALNLINGR